MRRRIAWPAALVGLALLAGCVSIPTGGGVTTVQVEADDTDNPLLSLPPLPTQDSPPEQIVADFLRAGRGPQENYRVAREYLTDDFRATWVPGARTLISSTPIEPVELADNTWSVTISTSSSVDDHGRYATSTRSDTVELAFGLVQDDEGQWRINSAPDGTVLSADRFASIFAPYELYFFDPSYAFLVPDLRWYRSGSTAVRSVIDGVLAGPSDRLGAGALVSAFPSGTRRDDDDEPSITNGVALVPLSSNVNSGTGTAHRRMEQQLLASLGSITTVREVDITVGGFPIQVDDGGAPPDRDYLVGNDPIGSIDGQLGVLTEDGIQRLSGIGAAADAVPARGGSIVSRDRSAIALLGDTGVTIVRAGQDPVVIDGRPDLAVPSLDPLGFVWTVPRSSPSALRAISADGVPTDVPGLPSGRVVSLDVARDGTRVMVALDTAAGPRVVVAGIRRDGDGVPIEIVTPLDLPVGTAAVLDAAWVDGVRVVVLTDGALTSVDAYDIGGQHESLGEVEGGVSIVGGNGTDGTRVLDDQGNVMRPGGGTSWQDTGVDAAFLVSQQ